MQPRADVVIVGAGACGSLAACELTARGASVVVLEAGPRLDPVTDLRNSEANGGRIMWREPRVHTGQHPIVPKAGVGVGGGTLSWLGVMPRFHRADFRTASTEGVGDDWPIGYDDLRPHYEEVERGFGVAGECGPFAPEPYALPMPPHRMNWHAQVLARGARHAARIRSRRRSRSTRRRTTGGPPAAIAGGADRAVRAERRRRR